MGPADARVWRAALELNLVSFEKLEYDVRLGGLGAALIPDAHEHKRMWETLLRKRIDVVGWRRGVPWLVEVKPVAGFSALGQCLGYGFLWSKERGATPKPRLMTVCAVSDPDLMPVFALYGVSVVALPSEVAEALLAPQARREKGATT